MCLIYAGIDEAGYGPLLGPLCVGMTAVRVDDWRDEDGAPNLWKVLSRAVCRAGRKSTRHIAVDDSKKLKLANSSTTRHPTYFLERGVGAFLACRAAAQAVAEENQSAARTVPEHDGDLFAAVGVQVPPEPWYVEATQTVTFPVGSTRAEVMILANSLNLAMSSSGISVVDVACEAMGETVFNQIVESAGTKAAATEAALVKHLWTVWDAYGAIGAEEGSAVRVVCDRQGGRTDYTDMLARAFPGCEVRETHANQTQSRYEINSAPTDTSAKRRMSVLFMTESESVHLPVALASMTAKLVREMMMARFNRYWNGRMPELKPTAGYSTDARRWLDDARAVIREDERRAMLRRV